MFISKVKLITVFIMLSLLFAIYEFSSVFDTGTCASKDAADDCAGPSDPSAVPSKQRTDSGQLGNEINVIITFANAENKLDFHDKFAQTVGSLFRFASRPVILHIIGDTASQIIAKRIIEKEVQDSRKYKLEFLDVEKLAKELETTIRPLQERFSFKPGAYYSHALFFFSVAMHRVFPDDVKKVIMLDADLKFVDDVSNLYGHFDRFSADNVLGIAREAQPVYRHTFWSYRNSHPGTRVGEPPPNGLTGFNSGVLLLDLEKMRNSKLYNELLDGDSIRKLSEEFGGFKGHLGDQDFYTLVGMKHEPLVYVLPCQWNRQLCEWWRDHGLADVFDLYFRCDMDVKLYHGNCNTPIP